MLCILCDIYNKIGITLFRIYPDGILQTAQPFVTKFGMWSIILSRGVVQTDWLAVLKVKATGRAHECFYFFLSF